MQHSDIAIIDTNFMMDLRRNKELIFSSLIEFIHRMSPKTVRAIWRPQYFQNCKKFGHAARELVTVFSMTFYFLETVVGQMVKTPPSPNRKCLSTSLTAPVLRERAVPIWAKLVVITKKSCTLATRYKHQIISIALPALFTYPTWNFPRWNPDSWLVF